MRRAHGPHKVEGVCFWRDDWCHARSHSELLCPPGRSAFCDLHVLGLFCEVSMIRPPQSTQRCADEMMPTDVTARFCAISSRVAYGMYPGGTEARNAVITVSRVPCLLIAPAVERCAPPFPNLCCFSRSAGWMLCTCGRIHRIQQRMVAMCLKTAARRSAKEPRCAVPVSAVSAHAFHDVARAGGLVPL